MRSSNRIIRGVDAAELPNWSVELIGSRFGNPVEKLFAEMGHQQAQEVLPTTPPTDEEIRLNEWEQALNRRENKLTNLNETP